MKAGQRHKRGIPGILVLFLGGLGLWGLPLSPAQANPPSWVQRLEAHYQRLQGLEAHFRQTTELPGMGSREYQGVLYLQRPDRIRWDYQRPYPQQAYLEQDRLTLYNPQERQVFIRRVAPGEGLALVTTLLTRAEAWRAWFDLRPQGTSGKDQGVLDLIPRETGAFPRVRLWVDLQSLQIQALEWSLEEGPRVRVELRDIRENPAYPASWFAFTPPPGVDVLEWGP